MNYKLEKFWNISRSIVAIINNFMNYKLEKFWNIGRDTKSMDGFGKWTINLKSFEINHRNLFQLLRNHMNYKLEKFWNRMWFTNNWLLSSYEL